MPSYSQDERFLSLTTPLGADVLLLQSVEGSEGLSALFDFDLEVLATPDTTVSPADLIGKRVTFSVQVSEDGTQRPFNGMVASLQTFGGDLDFNTYRLHVVPALWLLSLNTQTRVFQNMTVVDVVKKVLTDYSITPTDDTQTTYTSLEYCTQYRESDLDFVLRLLEQHGIYFYFTHSTSTHTMVLGDTSAQLQDCAVQSSFRYEPNKAERNGFYDMVIESFAARSALTTGKFTLWDYRFSQFATAGSSSGSSSTRSALGSNEHEFYDYTDGASSYLKTDSGDGNTATQEGTLQTALRDMEDTQSLTVKGSSNASVLQPGFTFALTEYPQNDANTSYLITHVRHSLRQQPTYRTEAQSVADEPYSNSFRGAARVACLPSAAAHPQTARAGCGHWQSGRAFRRGIVSGQVWPCVCSVLVGPQPQAEHHGQYLVARGAIVGRQRMGHILLAAVERRGADRLSRRRS